MRLDFADYRPACRERMQRIRSIRLLFHNRAVLIPETSFC